MKYFPHLSVTLFCFQLFAQPVTPPPQRPQRPASVPRLHIAPAPMVDEAAGVWVVAEEEKASPDGLRILIVDDQELVTLSPRRHLGNALGHDVTVAKSGAEAIELLADQDFDLILMDHNMPEMNGLETTQVLRGMDVWTTVVSHSTSELEPEIRAAYEAQGVAHFFDKSRPTKAAYEALLRAISDEHRM